MNARKRLSCRLFRLNALRRWVQSQRQPAGPQQLPRSMLGVKSVQVCHTGTGDLVGSVTVKLVAPAVLDTSIVP